MYEADTMKVDTRTRGVLDENAVQGRYFATRVLPSESLSRHVAYFWLVRWNLERPYQQHVLALPAAHYVFEKNDRSGRRDVRIAGTSSKRFTRTLEGAGHILGIAFHAGLAAPFLHAPIARFTDQLVPVKTKIFTSAATKILEARTDALAVAEAEAFIASRLPELDDESLLAAELVEKISADRSLCRVEQLAELSGRGERALQRLFHRNVGLSPKAVIRRFRLVEAAELLARKKGPRLTELAQSLGYFDQAHFIRDFKSFVGRLPSEYRQSASR